MKPRDRLVGIIIGAIALLLAGGCTTNKPNGKNERALPLGWFTPPDALANDFGAYRSPLRFDDGTTATRRTWPKRRTEIFNYWHGIMGPWPPLLPHPGIDFISQRTRENFTENKIRVQIAENLKADGYLLIPEGHGPFPAVLVVYYEPETSIGISQQPLRDFAYQLAKRGFVTLSIGSPGGDARQPESVSPPCQPLSFLAYVAANCHTALAGRKEVDPKRIGVAGHSYGGKWAMFASCLFDKFACAAWSDPGIGFDEAKPNVNYWEPWYLGADPSAQRRPGVITAQNPRTGAYKQMVETGHDLHELHALMAPRPFLVSGGSEDGPARWIALNHARAVNRLLGFRDRVAMTNRPAHNPTVESNEQIYSFFEHYLVQSK